MSAIRIPTDGEYEVTFSTDLDPARTHAEIHTRELPGRPDAAIDRWFGAATILIGAATSAVGIFRTQANIPIYAYGAALILCGALLVQAGRRA